jgi:transcriptional regulator with XRE-family HTH domain
MDAHELRRQRLRLGYTVAVLAEVLNVDARLLRDWESGAVPVPEWLNVAVGALVEARTQPDDNLLIASGTFASRRRMQEMSKLLGSRPAEPPVQFPRRRS